MTDTEVEIRAIVQAGLDTIRNAATNAKDALIATGDKRIAASLIPEGGRVLTAERLAELIADAPAANYEENDYNAGYVAALIDLRDALFPAAEPSDPVVPKPEHPYFVWEQGYQAAVTDSDAGVDGTRGNAYTSNPYSLGESEPDPATEPAKEETKAEGLRKFRKKPVEVEAMQYDGKDWRSIAQWMAVCGAPMGRTASGLLRIHTLEGEMTASSGDWIIKGTQGEFYPCKPAPFADTFEPASSPVVPAPTETGPWQTLGSVPASVNFVRDGSRDLWRRHESRWEMRGPYDQKLNQWCWISLHDIERGDQYAPFVAAEGK